MNELQSERQRAVYLTTYSRIDSSKSFSVRILQWVVSIEAPSAPTGSFACAEMNCYHFHMTVKLAESKVASSKELFR